MEYNLIRATYNNTIAVAGCGGTGGFVAESLCRLLIGLNASLILVDPDDVQPHNLLRQNFQEKDVGHNKAISLATRLSNIYRRPVTAIAHEFPHYRSGQQSILDRKPPALIVGCMDSATGRMAVEKWVDHPSAWWIDCGNDRDWGQVLIGNRATWSEDDQACAFQKESPGGDSYQKGRCNLLPSPLLQQPGLKEQPPEEPSPDLDCAQAIMLRDQDPVINQVMAALAVSAVYRLLTGKCNYMAQYVNLANGTVNTRYASPENTAKFAAQE